MHNQKTFLNIEEVAKEFGISHNTARKECREGSLKDVSKKVGQRYFIHREALHKKFLKEVE